MPTSPYAHLYPMVEYLNEARPASLLDIGVGNGKIGFIARDFLDVILGERYRKEDWQIRIDGIEIFSAYIQNHQKAIYDKIFIGDAFEIIDSVGPYDLIVLGDVLEHLNKEMALQLLDKCIARTKGHVIINIPLGEGWHQPEICGNPYEKHLSSWQPDDFQPFACDHKLFHYSAGPYGIFLIKKEDYIDYKIRELKASRIKEQTGFGASLRKRYRLYKNNISRINLNRFSKHVANPRHRNYFFDVDFREHYRLIAYLSTQFNHTTIFDIGTNLGYSALALSYSDSNRVISYDIVECKELNHAEELVNIEYCIGDVLKDERLLSSPLIMLDTNHDGIFENKFYSFLKENNYKGLLFLDDIHLNQQMEDFWNSIGETKEDLTNVGHWSGSGLVDFNLP
ncbi:MAG: hypothetical protein JSW26_13100 [Desulfobacterales bacterium]|nr:MAG: hypothetical protein JSW26_13100 [Desulfobacterales bacterium]